MNVLRVFVLQVVWSSPTAGGRCIVGSWGDVVQIGPRTHQVSAKEASPPKPKVACGDFFYFLFIFGNMVCRTVLSHNTLVTVSPPFLGAIVAHEEREGRQKMEWRRKGREVNFQEHGHLSFPLVQF